jgi:hypothetical protein
VDRAGLGGDTIDNTSVAVTVFEGNMLGNDILGVAVFLLLFILGWHELSKNRGDGPEGPGANSGMGGY